ncbi:hypothetical protein KF707_13660 [Candidatus Obscuribacterales bacterium]|nr:hypothetical protein [Candidatus Obscuribacterales bacterium]
MGGDDLGFPSEPDFEDGGPPPKPFVPPELQSAGSQKRFTPKPKPLLQYQGRTIVRDQGRIAYLMLPNKFELRDSSETDRYRRFDYMIPNYDSMRIGYWDWNNENSRVGEDIGAEFMALLATSPHDLSDDEIAVAEELIPLDLYGYSTDYDLLSLRTETFGGMNCLLMETKWWNQDLKATGLFFPSDATGRGVESVHFEGTEFDYRKTWLSAKAAFLRIKWK